MLLEDRRDFLLHFDALPGLGLLLLFAAVSQDSEASAPHTARPDEVRLVVALRHLAPDELDPIFLVAALASLRRAHLGVALLLEDILDRKALHNLHLVLGIHARDLTTREAANHADEERPAAVEAVRNDEQCWEHEKREKGFPHFDHVGGRNAQDEVHPNVGEDGG